MRLSGVRIPPALRGFRGDGLDADQAFDLVLDGGQVAQINPVDGAPQATLLSGFVDAHVHLDKTDTVSHVGAAEGDLFKAIARMDAHRATWTGADLYRRMDSAIDEAWRAGTRALRTHLDWVDPLATPPALAVFERLRSEWAGRMELQFASLTPLDAFDAPGALDHVAATVARAGGVLGAFVYRNENLTGKLERVIDRGMADGLPLDFHVDEGLDLDATGLQTIAALVRARLQARGQRARVLCSHACSLSVQPRALAEATLRDCAEAGLHLAALPATNLYLQGAWDATPIERGVTRLREARAAGVSTSVATDNVADGFYPYGSYDLLDTFALGVLLAHLAPVGDWVDAITVNPARALGLDWDGRIAVGCPADLVQVPARNDHELAALRGRARRVIRAGRLVT